MSENQEDNNNEELNFNELIGNPLTSHNEEQEQEQNNNNNNADEFVLVNDPSNHNGTKESGVDSNVGIGIDHMELPDIVGAGVHEEELVSNVSDFTTVVNNAIELIKLTDGSDGNAQVDANGPVVETSLTDEEQQNEWANILQRGLYGEDERVHDENDDRDQQNIEDTRLNDDALDQDDENLRRAILETLQILRYDSINEDIDNNNNNNNNNTLEGVKQIEILDKPSKKPSKKKRKEKDKDKQKQISHNSKTTTKKPSNQDDKKKSKSKKNGKEREKSKLSKNENKKKNNVQEEKGEEKVIVNDHLIQIDDVIRGIMESDTLLENNNDITDTNEHGVGDDTNDFETQALVEATLKAFEKELMASETNSASTTKTRKGSTTTKKTSSKSKPKSTTKKAVKSKVPATKNPTPTPSPTTTSKDLDYEIPISSFYPQPKKATTTSLKKKKKKKTTKPTFSSKEPQNVTTGNDDFQDDEFSKVLAEIVNKVVETSLAEPIEEKTKETEKGNHKELSEYTIDSSSKPMQKDISDDKVSKNDTAVAQTKSDHQPHVYEKFKPVDDDKGDDNDEPFDLNQIMQNAMSLAFQSKPRDIEETKEDSSLEERLEKIRIESPKPVESQDLERVEKVKDKEVRETYQKLEEDKHGSNDEEKNKEEKQKKTKSKKVAKTKKTEKINKSDIIKVKPAKEPKEKQKTSKKKTSEPTERKKFETIIIDNFQKKLASNSMNNVTSSMRKLNMQTKSRVDHKNREIIIRNVEIEKRFTKLKNGLIVKSQSPEEIFRKKFGVIAVAAAHEARKRRRQKNKELRLKLKEEKEKIKIAKKAQKELDQAKFDAEQKELAEIVARGPPYPPDLRLTKKGVPKKPYRRWTPEEMKLRAQLANESIDEVQPKVKALKTNKNSVVAITKAPLFNFIRLNVVLEENNLKDIKETLLKIHLPESHFDYLFSNTGTLGYSTDEIVKALENRTLDKFDPSAKTIVHKERFLFHPPWVLPDYPPIALPVARRSIASKKHNKKIASGLHDTSAFMAVTKKLIPTILNPIINTLKTAAKKRIANGASPEEATRHLLTIINHTKKSIAQVITNARNRQLRQSLTKVKLEDANNKTTVSTVRPSNLNRIPLLNTANRSKRPLENTDIHDSNTKQENVLKVLPLVPLTKRVKKDANLSPEVVVMPSHKDITYHNNLDKTVNSTDFVEVITQTKDISNDTDEKKDMSEKGTETESTTVKTTQTHNNQTPLQSSITDLGIAATSSSISNETTEPFKKNKTSLPPDLPALEKSDSNNDKTSVEIDSLEKVSDKVDNNPNKLVFTNKADVKVLEEPSKQVTIVDKVDNSASKSTRDTQDLLSDMNDSLTTPSDGSSATNDLTKEGSKSINSNMSNINVVGTILKDPTLENAVSSVTENDKNNTNKEIIEESTVEGDSKSTNLISQTVAIATEENLESQQDTVKPVSSKDNEEKKDVENFHKTIPEKNLDIEKNEINDAERKEKEKEVIEVKKENGSELKKIPINIPSITNKTITPNAPIKVESMVQSLVAQQLQSSNEEEDEALPIGITSIITSTLTDLLPKIQQDFITEEKRQRRSGPNSVLNLDGLVPPSQVKLSPEEKLLKNSIKRKMKPPKVKERRDVFQVKYNFNIPDFSNITGKKNILQKKLKEFLSNEEFDLLRKDISKERKRRWRDANGIQNKINDLRARLRKRATKAFGVENTKEKLEWIASTFEKKCAEAGFNEFLANKPNYSEKRDKSTITDNDILNMIAINLNRLDLAHKIEASLIEEAKVEVEPKRKKRKIEKLTGGTKESSNSSAVTNTSDSVSNDVESTKNVVTSDNSKDSSIENNGNPDNINNDSSTENNGNPDNISNDFKETSSKTIPDANIDSRLITI